MINLGIGNFARCFRGSRSFLMDAHARSLLAPMLEAENEILPIEPFKGVEFYFLNVIKKLQCLDSKRKIQVIKKEGDKVEYGIAEFQFYPEKLTDSTLFCCEAPGIFTVVGRPNAGVEFKTLVEQEGLTGLTFEEVWSEGGPAIRRNCFPEKAVSRSENQPSSAAVKGDSSARDEKPPVIEVCGEERGRHCAPIAGNGQGGMKVFEVHMNLDYKTCFLSNHESKLWHSPMINGRIEMHQRGRLAPHWGKVSLKLHREKCKLGIGNFVHCWQGSGNFLMDAHAHKILAPMLEAENEILPVEAFKGVDYYLLNVLKELDCLDRDNTLYGESSGTAGYQFHPEKLTDSPLFTVKWTGGLFTVVGRPNAGVEFKTLVEQEGLTGLRFEEVWWEGGPTILLNDFWSGGKKVISGSEQRALRAAAAAAKGNSENSNEKPPLVQADGKDATTVKDDGGEQPLPSLGFSDREEAIATIHNSLSAMDKPLVKDIESYLLPSARLYVCDEDGKETVAGTRLTASYFGGQPTLPANVAWPAWGKGGKIADSDRLAEAGGTPLPFLGQVSLREMQALAPMPGWPKEGILAFFYLANDCDQCRILFFPEGGPLEPADYPEQLEEEDRFPQRALTARPEWTLEKYLRRKSDGTELINQKEYLELLERLNSDGSDARPPVHRFGGHAQEIQNRLRSECELLAHGIRRGDSWISKDSLAVEPSDADADWQLVMQFDSEFDHLDWEWGDGGRVYFMARRQDIEAGDFSNNWATLQCY
ncbi:MAG: YwqG family protein [Terracidiphilus sp.]